MRKFSALLVTACMMSLLILASSVATFGQGTQPQPSGDKKPQDPAVERKAYDALQACIAEKDNSKKLAMAKEALGLYPNTTYVPYLKDQITQARGGLLTQAVQANKPTEAFSIGEEILNENPENLDLLIFLSRYALQTAKASKD